MFSFFKKNAGLSFRISLHQLYYTLLEREILDKGAEEHAAHVGGLIPRGLGGHGVGDLDAFDGEILEADVRYAAFLVIALDDGELASTSELNVAEQHTGDGLTRGLTVLLVLEDAQCKQCALTDAIDADAVERNVLDHVVVATYNGHASLVIDLTLVVLEDVEVAEDDIADGVANDVIVTEFAWIAPMVLGLVAGGAVYANHDGMSHIGPEGAVFDEDVVTASDKTCSRGIDGHAVITGATETTS